MDAALAARLIRHALVVVAALLAAPVYAFAPFGHEVVAEIAARRLDPQTRAVVERLLGEPASPGLRAISGWADEARTQPAWSDTVPLHYINVPEGTCDFQAARDCRRGRCVTGELERQVAILADARRSDAERELALRFVVHFVADVHQPMHVGLRSDRGGNNVQLRLGRKGTNLHQVWDSGLLNESGRLRGRRWSAVEYANALLARPAPASDVRWSAQAPERWAEESCALMRTAYPKEQRIGDEYVRRHLPELEQRMLEAGYRLAALLNQVL